MIFVLVKVVLSLAKHALKFKFVESRSLKSAQLTVVHGLGTASSWTVVLLSLPVLQTSVAEYNFTLHAFGRYLGGLLAYPTHEVLVERLAHCVFFTGPIPNQSSTSSCFLNYIFKVAELNSLFSNRLITLCLSRKPFHLGFEKNYNLIILYF